MESQETMRPGEAILAVAAQEIDQGNHLKGAELVWQATMAAMSAAAARHGMPCRDREEALRFVRHLDDLTKQPGAGFDPGPAAEDAAQFPHYNLAAFSTADAFREHYENLDELEGTEFQWEPDEYAVFLESVRDFVASLNRQSNGL